MVPRRKHAIKNTKSHDTKDSNQKTFSYPYSKSE